MDKIHKKLPIRQRPVKQPVVFAFNIILSQYNAYRNAQYMAV